jgi:hypothetical protein
LAAPSKSWLVASPEVLLVQVASLRLMPAPIPSTPLFHAVLDIQRHVCHHFLPSRCAWTSRRPPSVETRPLAQLAIRESGNDGSTCLLSSARNASIRAAVSAGRVTMNRWPSSIIRSSAFAIEKPHASRARANSSRPPCSFSACFAVSARQTRHFRPPLASLLQDASRQSLTRRPILLRSRIVRT